MAPQASPASHPAGASPQSTGIEHLMTLLFRQVLLKHQCYHSQEKLNLLLFSTVDPFQHPSLKKRVGDWVVRDTGVEYGLDRSVG